MRNAMIFAMLATVAAQAVAQVAIVRPEAAQAIGPKQDDPRACRIGPKQDDSLTVDVGKAGGGMGTASPPGTYNPETDPHAAGGSGAQAIGPKQDDPRSPNGLAIGPKQDDPRVPGLAKVDCYDPETDPQALKAIQGKTGRTK